MHIHSLKSMLLRNAQPLSLDAFICTCWLMASFNIRRIGRGEEIPPQREGGLEGALTGAGPKPSHYHWGNTETKSSGAPAACK